MNPPRISVRRPLKIVLVAVIALAVVAGVAFAWYATAPRWTGSGDWAACSRLATVGPEQAVRIVTNTLRVDLLQNHAVVTPGYVNETGWGFTVTCGDHAVVGDPIASWSMPPADHAEHLGWSVIIEGDWTLCATPAFVDWTTGAELMWTANPGPAC